METRTEPAYEGWAVLELMGHRRLGGYLAEATLAGAAFIRIDVPAANEGDTPSTQFYAPAAVYCITPTTEEIARAVAENWRPAPVERWQLPALQAPREYDSEDKYDEEEPPF